MSVWSRARALLARFWSRHDGVAAVEFAMIAPIMLLVYLGSMEGSALLTMDRRIQTISNSVGDLVARGKDRVSMSEIDDYFTAARIIMAPYSTSGLVQRVVSVQVDKDGKGVVRWSRDSGKAVPYAKGTSYALPAEITDIAREGFVIVAEATMPYTPLTGLVFNQQYTLYRENFYMPRFGNEIELLAQ
ncbi:TadE/TadG family type IV pilus assembly protein [Devosia limi]|uniref:Flp pilus assembly protein TadG n=1 Tax=Devosia limi DSM 17137 TaxID=1121477 RepID=A0A1M5BK71_9HYPH|nr:TadE/TadG family type IV pilus assembly protein [Devosia limi]SHF42858.1 Flp pilus assembly protein TadG [Devosia limi DSM 17137]